MAQRDATRSHRQLATNRGGGHDDRWTITQQRRASSSYGIVCAAGETYSTFSVTIGEAAKRWIGQAVEISWQTDKSGKYKTCMKIEDNEVPF